jgi:hypothetical protein
MEANMRKLIIIYKETKKRSSKKHEGKKINLK